jgi:hypothetical protein
MAKIKSGVTVGSPASSFTVEVPSTIVSGNVTVAGTTADVLSRFSGSDSLFSLTSADGGTVPLNVNAAGAYSARVVPGTYDLYFGSSGAVATSAPSNVAAKLQSGIVIGAAPLSLDIQVPAVTVSGTATLNGAPITAAGQNRFVLTLQSAAGDRAQLTHYLAGGAFSASVIPGNYDLYYASESDTEPLVPNNLSTKIRSGIVVGSSPVILDVDIRGTTVTGAITVNGAPATSGAVDDFATLILLQDQSDAALLAGLPSTTGSYSTFVLPGTYQLYYVLYRSSGTLLPMNSSTLLGCFTVL